MTDDDGESDALQMQGSEQAIAALSSKHPAIVRGRV